MPEILGPQGWRLGKHPRLLLPGFEGLEYVLYTSSEGAHGGDLPIEALSLGFSPSVPWGHLLNEAPAPQSAAQGLLREPP